MSHQHYQDIPLILEFALLLITFILLNQQKKYILRRLGCWPIENQHQQVPAIGARLRVLLLLI